MKKLILLSVIALFAVPRLCAAQTTTFSWHDGVFSWTLTAAQFQQVGTDGQDVTACNRDQNHHTHVGAPGEGADVSGWCDALNFRQRTFTVPATATSATLTVALHFGSGNEPPTDLLPPDESARGECDVEAYLTTGDASQVFVGGSSGLVNPANLVASTVGTGNTPHQSPHLISQSLTPGKTYTLTIDPFAGVHAEWHIDADLSVN